MMPEEVIADLDPAEVGNCGCLIPDNDEGSTTEEEPDDD